MYVNDELLIARESVNFLPEGRPGLGAAVGSTTRKRGNKGATAPRINDVPPVRSFLINVIVQRQQENNTTTTTKQGFALLTH